MTRGEINIEDNINYLKTARKAGMEDQTIVPNKKNNIFSGLYIFGRKNILLVAAILILLIGIILNAKAITGSFTKNPTSGNITGSEESPTLNDKESKKILDKVSKHIVMPLENPKVLILQNTQILKEEQEFFRASKDGDVLLVYSNKVILYDPATDKIIDIAQIRITPQSDKQEAGEDTAFPTPLPKYKVAILNGTRNEKALEKMNELAQNNNFLEVVRSGNAVLRTYQKSYLVSLKEADKATVNEIARSLSTTVGNLNSREATPELEWDFIVIVGAEFANTLN